MKISAAVLWKCDSVNFTLCVVLSMWPSCAAGYDDNMWEFAVTAVQPVPILI